MINFFTEHHPYFISTAVVFSFLVTKHAPSIRSIKSWWDFVFMKLVHQYLVNLSGCLLGWSALYYLIYMRPSGVLTLTDLIIILVAYVGIAGYLPDLIINKGFKP